MELSQSAVCRICYSGENSSLKSGEPLISPCHCKGTMGLYHRTCLKKWLLSSNKLSCEICGFRFEIKSKSRSFLTYLNDENAVAERRTLCMDLLCFFILTPLIFLSVVVCVSFAIEFQHYVTHDGVSEPRVGIAVCLYLLAFTLMFAYCAWIVVTIIFHEKSFQYWQRLNPDFEVTDQLSAEDSILVNNPHRTTTIYTTVTYSKQIRQPQAHVR